VRQLLRAIAAALAAIAAVNTAASPVPADEISLLNGADSFAQYCTECHGWDPALQYDSLYDPDPDVDLLFDLESLDADISVGGEFPTAEEVDDWPEWAEPRPDVPDEEELMRAGVLSDLAVAIDDVYGDGSDGMFGEDPDSQPPRAPGATDLTDPASFKYGTSENDLYDSITRGAGMDMPGFRERLGSEDAVWNLVNYIRSLWGEDWVD
jgi:mono/diheme cytochrome c family protein